MTDETLKKVIDLQQGAVKRVCDLPDEIHKLLIQVYVGRIMKLTEDFHNI